MLNKKMKFTMMALVLFMVSMSTAFADMKEFDHGVAVTLQFDRAKATCIDMNLSHVDQTEG